MTANRNVWVIEDSSDVEPDIGGCQLKDAVINAATSDSHKNQVKADDPKRNELHATIIASDINMKEAMGEIIQEIESETTQENSIAQGGILKAAEK